MLVMRPASRCPQIILGPGRFVTGLKWGVTSSVSTATQAPESAATTSATSYLSRYPCEAAFGNLKWGPPFQASGDVVKCCVALYSHLGG